MTVTVAFAGDTMLGRGVADRLHEAPPHALVSEGVVEFARRADLFVMNLECCISERGSKWPVSGKPFFFRAPRQAVDLLTHLGVSCVTLANNHALDYGEDALLDTLVCLRGAGIASVGAGPDESTARKPAVFAAGGLRVAVLGITDHPNDFAAGPDRPGVAFADLRHMVPDWVIETIQDADADAAIVTPHWGPNMTKEPVPHVRAAASAMVGAGAMFVTGHSAHVFHGLHDRVLFDVGDFLDDYSVDPTLRNDLGILPLLTLDEAGPVRLEILPLKLEFAHTRVAEREEAVWIRHRFRRACEPFGTQVQEEDGRLVVQWR